MPIPRNPKATVGILLATLAVGVPIASGGPPAKRGCAHDRGNCSGKHLIGKHYIKMSLTRSRWVKANLYLASFRFSDLYSSHFRNANLSRADLSRGNRTKSDFRNANLSYANLTNADFYGSNLRKANLRNARIVNTRFDNTNLFGADFTGAYLKGVTINGARLCNTIQPNGTERDDNCSKDGVPPGGEQCLPYPPDGCQSKDDKDKGSGDNNGGNGNNNGNGGDGGVIVGTL